MRYLYKKKKKIHKERNTMCTIKGDNSCLLLISRFPFIKNDDIFPVLYSILGFAVNHLHFNLSYYIMETLKILIISKRTHSYISHLQNLFDIKHMAFYGIKAELLTEKIMLGKQKAIKSGGKRGRTL